MASAPQPSIPWQLADSMAHAAEGQQAFEALLAATIRDIYTTRRVEQQTDGLVHYNGQAAGALAGADIGGLLSYNHHQSLASNRGHDSTPSATPTNRSFSKVPTAIAQTVLGPLRKVLSSSSGRPYFGESSSAAAGVGASSHPDDSSGGHDRIVSSDAPAGDGTRRSTSVGSAAPVAYHRQQQQPSASIGAAVLGGTWNSVETVSDAPAETNSIRFLHGLTSSHRFGGGDDNDHNQGGSSREAGDNTHHDDNAGSNTYDADVTRAQRSDESFNHDVPSSRGGNGLPSTSSGVVIGGGGIMAYSNDYVPSPTDASSASPIEGFDKTIRSVASFAPITSATPTSRPCTPQRQIHSSQREESGGGGDQQGFISSETATLTPRASLSIGLATRLSQQFQQLTPPRKQVSNTAPPPQLSVLSALLLTPALMGKLTAQRSANELAIEFMLGHRDVLAPYITLSAMATAHPASIGSSFLAASQAEEAAEAVVPVRSASGSPTSPPLAVPSYEGMAPMLQGCETRCLFETPLWREPALTMPPSNLATLVMLRDPQTISVRFLKHYGSRAFDWSRVANFSASPIADNAGLSEAMVYQCLLDVRPLSHSKVAGGATNHNASSAGHPDGGREWPSLRRFVGNNTKPTAGTAAPNNKQPKDALRRRLLDGPAGTVSASWHSAAGLGGCGGTGATRPPAAAAQSDGAHTRGETHSSGQYSLQDSSKRRGRQSTASVGDSVHARRTGDGTNTTSRETTTDDYDEDASSADGANSGRRAKGSSGRKKRDLLDMDTSSSDDDQYIPLHSYHGLIEGRTMTVAAPWQAELQRLYGASKHDGSTLGFAPSAGAHAAPQLPMLIDPYAHGLAGAPEVIRDYLLGLPNPLALGELEKAVPLAANARWGTQRGPTTTTATQGPIQPLLWGSTDNIRAEQSLSTYDTPFANASLSQRPSQTQRGGAQLAQQPQGGQPTTSSSVKGAVMRRVRSFGHFLANGPAEDEDSATGGRGGQRPTSGGGGAWARPQASTRTPIPQPPHHARSHTIDVDGGANNSRASSSAPNASALFGITRPSNAQHLHGGTANPRDASSASCSHGDTRPLSGSSDSAPRLPEFDVLTPLQSLTCAPQTEPTAGGGRGSLAPVALPPSGSDRHLPQLGGRVSGLPGTSVLVSSPTGRNPQFPAGLTQKQFKQRQQQWLKDLAKQQAKETERAKKARRSWRRTQPYRLHRRPPPPPLMMIMKYYNTELVDSPNMLIRFTRHVTSTTAEVFATHELRFYELLAPLFSENSLYFTPHQLQVEQDERFAAAEAAVIRQAARDQQLLAVRTAHRREIVAAMPLANQLVNRPPAHLMGTSNNLPYPQLRRVPTFVEDDGFGTLVVGCGGAPLRNTASRRRKTVAIEGGGPPGIIPAAVPYDDVDEAIEARNRLVEGTSVQRCNDPSAEVVRPSQPIAGMIRPGSGDSMYSPLVPGLMIRGQPAPLPDDEPIPATFHTTTAASRGNPYYSLAPSPSRADGGITMVPNTMEDMTARQVSDVLIVVGSADPDGLVREPTSAFMSAQPPQSASGVSGSGGVGIMRPSSNPNASQSLLDGLLAPLTAQPMNVSTSTMWGSGTNGLMLAPIHGPSGGQGGGGSIGMPHHPYFSDNVSFNAASPLLASGTIFPTVGGASTSTQAPLGALFGTRIRSPPTGHTAANGNGGGLDSVSQRFLMMAQPNAGMGGVGHQHQAPQMVGLGGAYLWQSTDQMPMTSPLADDLALHGPSAAGGRLVVTSAIPPALRQNPNNTTTTNNTGVGAGRAIIVDVGDPLARWTPDDLSAANEASRSNVLPLTTASGGGGIADAQNQWGTSSSSSSSGSDNGRSARAKPSIFRRILAKFSRTNGHQTSGKEKDGHHRHSSAAGRQHPATTVTNFKSETDMLELLRPGGHPQLKGMRQEAKRYRLRKAERSAAAAKEEKERQQKGKELGMQKEREGLPKSGALPTTGTSGGGGSGRNLDGTTNPPTPLNPPLGSPNTAAPSVEPSPIRSRTLGVVTSGTRSGTHSPKPAQRGSPLLSVGPLQQQEQALPDPSPEQQHIHSHHTATNTLRPTSTSKRPPRRYDYKAHEEGNMRCPFRVPMVYFVGAYNKGLPGLLKYVCCAEGSGSVVALGLEDMRKAGFTFDHGTASSKTATFYWNGRRTLETSALLLTQATASPSMSPDLVRQVRLQQQQQQEHQHRAASGGVDGCAQLLPPLAVSTSPFRTFTQQPPSLTVRQDPLPMPSFEDHNTGNECVPKEPSAKVSYGAAPTPLFSPGTPYCAPTAAGGTPFGLAVNPSSAEGADGGCGPVTQAILHPLFCPTTFEFRSPLRRDAPGLHSERQICAVLRGLAYLHSVMWGRSDEPVLRTDLDVATIPRLIHRAVDEYASANPNTSEKANTAATSLLKMGFSKNLKTLKNVRSQLQKWFTYAPTDVLLLPQVENAILFAQDRWEVIREEALRIINSRETIVHGDAHYKNCGFKVLPLGAKVIGVPAVKASTHTTAANDATNGASNTTKDTLPPLPPNPLLQYDSEEQMMQACFLDFQGCGGGSIAAELLYFMCTSCPVEVVEEEVIPSALDAYVTSKLSKSARHRQQTDELRRLGGAANTNNPSPRDDADGGETAVSAARYHYPHAGRTSSHGANNSAGLVTFVDGAIGGNSRDFIVVDTAAGGDGSPRIGKDEGGAPLKPATFTVTLGALFGQTSTASSLSEPWIGPNRSFGALGQLNDSIVNGAGANNSVGGGGSCIGDNGGVIPTNDSSLSSALVASAVALTSQLAPLIRGSCLQPTVRGVTGGGGGGALGPLASQSSLAPNVNTTLASIYGSLSNGLSSAPSPYQQRWSSNSAGVGGALLLGADDGGGSVSRGGSSRPVWGNDGSSSLGHAHQQQGGMLLASETCWVSEGVSNATTPRSGAVAGVPPGVSLFPPMALLSVQHQQLLSSGSATTTLVPSSNSMLNYSNSGEGIGGGGPSPLQHTTPRSSSLLPPSVTPGAAPEVAKQANKPVTLTLVPPPAAAASRPPPRPTDSTTRPPNAGPSPTTSPNNHQRTTPKLTLEELFTYDNCIIDYYYNRLLAGARDGYVPSSRSVFRDSPFVVGGGGGVGLGVTPADDNAMAADGHTNPAGGVVPPHNTATGADRARIPMTKERLVREVYILARHWAGCLLFDLASSTPKDRQRLKKLRQFHDLIEWGERTSRRVFLMVASAYAAVDAHVEAFDRNCEAIRQAAVDLERQRLYALKKAVERAEREQRTVNTQRDKMARAAATAVQHHQTQSGGLGSGAAAQHPSSSAVSVHPPAQQQHVHSPHHHLPSSSAATHGMSMGIPFSVNNQSPFHFGPNASGVTVSSAAVGGGGGVTRANSMTAAQPQQRNHQRHLSEPVGAVSRGSNDGFVGGGVAGGQEDATAAAAPTNSADAPGQGALHTIGQFIVSQQQHSERE